MNFLRRLMEVTIVTLAMFGSFSLVWMATDRTPPIEYEGARALKPSVARGGAIDIEFKVFRTRICSLVARRWLTDALGEKHSIPSYTVGPQMLAGRETYSRSITIPMAAALGPAWYEVALDYSCNIFHQWGFPIRVVSPPVPFNITDDDLDR